MARKKKKEKIPYLDLMYEEIKKDKTFFPLTADFERWWRYKGADTGFKRIAHLILGKYAYNKLKDLGFDINLEGDFNVRERTSKGVPKEYDEEIKIEAEKNINGKKFKVVLNLTEPSWKHFYYTREYYIDGKKVRMDKFFRELLKEDEQIRNQIFEKVKRKIKERVFDL